MYIDMHSFIHSMHIEVEIILETIIFIFIFLAEASIDYIE